MRALSATWTPATVEGTALIVSTTSYIGETLEDGLGGQGRMVRYATPISVKKVESMVKFWLKLDQSQSLFLLLDLALPSFLLTLACISLQFR